MDEDIYTFSLNRFNNLYVKTAYSEGNELPLKHTKIQGFFKVPSVPKHVFRHIIRIILTLQHKKWCCATSYTCASTFSQLMPKNYTNVPHEACGGVRGNFCSSSAVSNKVASTTTLSLLFLISLWRMCFTKCFFFANA